MTRSALTALAMLVLSVTTASAQAPAPADSVPRAMLDRAASSNWYLRAITFDAPHDTITGRIRALSGRYRIGDEWVERSAIRSLERRVDKGSGALVGALVGAIVVGVLAESLADWNEPSDDTPNFIAFGFGAGAGAMFGAFTGHAMHPGRSYWTPIWPAP